MIESLEKIIDADISEEFKNAFLEYASYVNLERAVPEVADGCKPVARRVLFTAHRLGLSFDRPHKKSARLVGEVIGTVHGHGDTSVYEAATRLSQPWVMRYPLIDFQGNNGSCDGDSPASPRYTEMRLSRVGEYMLKGLDKNVIDMKLNFSDDLYEPKVLPSLFPNLLVNPTRGIGVAMATSFAPNNLREVAEAIKIAINDFSSKKSEVLAPMTAPDFPTGGIIINGKDMKKIYETGSGTIKLRGKYLIEDSAKFKTIVFYEIPYAVDKCTIVNEILELAEDKDCPLCSNISNVQDASTRDGMRIEIKVKKDTEIEQLLFKLFSKTSLQNNYHVNQTVVAKDKIKEVNFYQAIKSYIVHQTVCLRREIRFDTEKLAKKKQVLEGLLVALADGNIEQAVQLIKEANSTADAVQSLMKHFNIVEPQAQAIVDMRLKRLTSLEKEEIAESLRLLNEEYDKLQTMLSSRRALKDELIRRIDVMVAELGDDRRTAVIDIGSRIPAKGILTPRERSVYVVIDAANNLKAIPIDKYPKTASDKKLSLDNMITHKFETVTDKQLIGFGQSGLAYAVAVSDIPLTTMSGKGVPLEKVSPFGMNNKCLAWINPETDADKELLLTTEKGYMKKFPASLFLEHKINKRGLKGTTLDKGDLVASVKIISEDVVDVVVATQKGKGVIFDLSTVATLAGRASKGSRKMKVAEGDKVAGVDLITKNTKGVLTGSTTGMGVFVSLENIPKPKSPSVVGRILVSATDKNPVSTICTIEDTQEAVIGVSDLAVREFNLDEVRDRKDFTSTKAAGAGLIKGLTSFYSVNLF